MLGRSKNSFKEKGKKSNKRLSDLPGHELNLEESLIPSREPPSLLLDDDQVDPEAYEDLDKLHQDYQNRLVVALECRDDDATKALIKKGARYDVPNEKGQYPLEAAIWGINEKAVKEILNTVGIAHVPGDTKAEKCQQLDAWTSRSFLALLPSEGAIKSAKTYGELWNLYKCSKDDLERFMPVGKRLNGLADWKHMDYVSVWENRNRRNDCMYGRCVYLGEVLWIVWEMPHSDRTKNESLLSACGLRAECLATTERIKQALSEVSLGDTPTFQPH